MPPKSVAPPKGQQTLSSFFTKATPPSALTSTTPSTSLPQRENDRPEAPPAKRAKTTLDSGTSRVQQWQYSPSRSVAAEEQVGRLPSSQRSLDDDRRHLAFRRRLLGTNDPIRRHDNAVRRSQDAEEEEEGSPEIGDESHSVQEEEHMGAARDATRTTIALSRFAGIASSSQPPMSSKSLLSSNSPAIKYTPLEEQVLHLKAKHPGVLLLFEVGYKFIAYQEDAIAASQELNISCFPKHHLRQASIPVHRLHIHVRRLVNAGYKVGVVRQTETRALKAASSNASTPFTRNLTELYTASTWVEDLQSEHLVGDAALAQRSLIALVERLEGGNYGADDKVSIGLISVQAATGSVVYDQFVDSSMRNELETRIAHLQPAGLLLPPAGSLSKPTEKLLSHLSSNISKAFSAGPTAASVSVERTDEVMSYNEAFALISRFYEEVSPPEGADDGFEGLDACDLERAATDRSARQVDEEQTKWNGNGRSKKALAVVMKMPHLATIALATCLQYLRAFGLSSIFTVPSSFVSFQARSEMLLSAGTLYNLELFLTTDGTHTGSLLWLLDKCKTAFGRRVLKRWISRPLTDLKRLRERTEAVSELSGGTCAVLRKLPELLIQQPDLEKGLARILYGRASPDELATVLLALNRISQQFKVTEAMEVGTRSVLLNESIAALPQAKETIMTALSEINLAAARKGEKENMFVEGKFPQLQEEKERIAVVDCSLHDHLLELKKLLHRPSLEYVTVSGIECLVEVRVADAKKVPADWLRMSATKSLVRFHTPSVIRLLKLKNMHKELLAAEAVKAYRSFLDHLCESSSELRSTIAALGTLDALLSLAAVATLPGYIRPMYIEGEGVLSIKGLRHPMSEVLRDDYVPNDVSFEGGNTGMILTGANMGGKSSTVRAIALCVIMGQIGSYVPATSATLSIYDAVLTRMGASDFLAKGRSTFMVEAEEAAEVMRVSTSRSLVILDEMGRGTSTFDGQAIASSILTHLMTRDEQRRPILLFITHYTSLCNLAHRLPGLRNMHMDFVEVPGQTVTRKEVIFLYKLKEGPASSSFGIHCASLAGLPTALLEVAASKANELLAQTESRLGHNRMKAARRALQAAFHTTSREMALRDIKDSAARLGLPIAAEPDVIPIGGGESLSN